MSNISSIPAHLINEAMGAACAHIEDANNNPEVGMCGTYYIGSDSYAYVVVDVLSKKKINATSDTVISTYDIDDFLKYNVKLRPYINSTIVNRNGDERHKYSIDILKYAVADEKGIKRVPVEFIDMWREYVERVNRNREDKIEFYETYTLRKNGRWVRPGSGMWNAGGIHLGDAIEYRDPSF
jgi:hypothetical protein